MKLVKQGIKKTKKMVKSITDSWTNVAQGVGVSGVDKTIGSYSIWKRTLRSEAEHLYASDDIAASIVDAIPDDMVKEGITWKIQNDKDGKITKALCDEYDRLCVWERINWAMKLSRIHGGACILIVADDGGDFSDPLRIERVRKITCLRVIDRWSLHIMPTDIDSDIESPNFGKPIYYSYNSSDAPGLGSEYSRIHHSRIIRFDGVQLPNDLFINNGYWHDSVFGKTFKPIANYGTANGSICTTIAEINQPVYKLAGMTEAISQDESELVINKLNFTNLMRSSLRAIVLDKEDEFDFKQVAVAGVADLFNIVKERLVAASGIPHTRLMGESPGASLGESGGSQLRDYYDSVAKKQALILRDPLDRLTRLIFKQTKLSVQEPEEWTYEFNPLYIEPQSSIIQTRYTQAQIDQIYVNMGVYDSVEVASSRFVSKE